ncbi:HEAT repeat domain-containing protein [bacterium]|nr:HEAT repeat domain-containing protein [bacterium]
MDHIDELIQKLGDPDNDVQLKAECALIRSDKAAVGRLIEATKYANPQIRWRAAFSLGEIGDQRGYPAVLALLDDKDMQVRADAVDAAGKLGGVNAIEPLSKVIMDASNDSHVATHAAWELMWMGDVALPALLDVWRYGTLEARKVVVQPLGEIGNPAAIEPLAEYLNDESLRFDVASALGKLGDIRALDVLIDYLCDHREDYSEGSAEWGLIGLGTLAVERLVEVTVNGSPEAKKEAIHALGEIGDASAIDRLTVLLDVPELDCAALIALGKCGDKCVLPRLLEMAREADEDWDVEVASAIGKFGDEAVEELSRVANLGVKYSREMAACALSNIASEKSISVLEHMLTDPDDDVRYWVLDSIWEIGSGNLPIFGQRSLDLIETLLDDADNTVRCRAASWSCSLRQDLAQPFNPIAWFLVGNY